MPAPSRPARPAAPTFRETLALITMLQSMGGGSQYLALPVGMMAATGTSFANQKACVMIYDKGPCDARNDCKWVVKTDTFTTFAGTTSKTREWCEDRAGPKNGNYPDEAGGEAAPQGDKPYGPFNQNDPNRPNKQEKANDGPAPNNGNGNYLPTSQFAPAAAVAANDGGTQPPTENGWLNGPDGRKTKTYEDEGGDLLTGVRDQPGASKLTIYGAQTNYTVDQANYADAAHNGGSDYFEGVSDSAGGSTVGIGSPS